MVKLIAFLLAAFLPALALAQQPIKIIVPFGAGGGLDNLARAVAEEIRKGGEMVIVENKPGASTIIGTRSAINSSGRTLLATVAVLVQLPHLYRVPPFELRELKPVSLAVRASTVLMVSKASGLSTDLKQILAAAKVQQINYASYGTGTTAHLNGALLEKLAGVPLVHVPYKGGVDAMQDLYAGRVQLSFDATGTAIDSWKAGKVGLVAVAAEQRLAAIPQVPTLRELGYPVGITGWQGFLAPASMPDAEVVKLNALVVSALRQPHVAAMLQRWGLELVASSPAEFAWALREQYAAWRQVIASVGLLGSM